ncbi:hypothetical protein JXD38_03950 [candidate division WOR-3 bacterium]|nr:hypothetical protein [candidate division WOR-3 bacterium]
MLGARVAPDGTLIDTSTISSALDDQVGARLAFDGEKYLATWSDRRTKPEQVYYTRVAQDGIPLDPDGRRLLTQDSAAIQLSPVPASNGSGFLVAWLASSAGYVVSAARLGNDGEPLDTTAIQFTQDSVFQWSVALGTDGDNYLVVWSGEVPGNESTAFCCSRLSPDGIILDSVPITIARSLADVAEPAVAYLDGIFLVTWTDWRADGDIYACRIRQDGTVLDSGGFAVCVTSGIQHQPAVAAGNDRFVVCWSEFRDSTFDIYAASVDSSGQVGVKSEVERRSTGGELLHVLSNPARGAVRFAARQSGPIRVFDCRGGLVRVLDGRVWDGRDNSGRLVPAGSYVAVVERASCSFLLLR